MISPIPVCYCSIIYLDKPMLNAKSKTDCGCFACQSHGHFLSVGVFLSGMSSDAIITCLQMLMQWTLEDEILTRFAKVCQGTCIKSLYDTLSTGNDSC